MPPEDERRAVHDKIAPMSERELDQFRAVLHHEYLQQVVDALNEKAPNYGRGHWVVTGD